MSTVSSPEPLPNDPSLEQLRKQARELQRDKRVADPAFPLSSAQREIARRYGFASWPRLVHHLEVVARYTWRPEDAPAAESLADEMLRFAFLTYTDRDGPARWERARSTIRRQATRADACFVVAVFRMPCCCLTARHGSSSGTRDTAGCSRR